MRRELVPNIGGLFCASAATCNEVDVEMRRREVSKVRLIQDASPTKMEIPYLDKEYQGSRHCTSTVERLETTSKLNIMHNLVLGGSF